MDAKTFSAKTVEEAITKALIDLQTTSDKLIYEVVEKGSSGFLGIGARPAVIRAKAPQPQPDEEIIKEAEQQEQAESLPKTIESFAALEKRAKDFLNQIMASMNMQVEIQTSHDEGKKEISINLEGEDMGILIGKRGQTLDSLQYLTSMVINKYTEGYVRVKLDTENYRSRRKETLETLAKNIAYKVKRTKRSVSLEPMNPYERRIIHASLQHDKYVTTKSEGEEPFRHVVICLKRDGSSYKDKEN